MSAIELGMGDRSTLVLVLHAFTSQPDDMDAVIAAAKSRWPSATYLCPELPLSLWSTEKPTVIVGELLALLDKVVSEAEQKKSPYTNIVLIGHSFGALLARKLYVVACGETPLAPFEAEVKVGGLIAEDGLLQMRPWASLVSRLVLLAGMNRGWRISHHLSIPRSLMWLTGTTIGHLLRLISGKEFVISTIRQGAEFITQLRIQWIRMRQSHENLGPDSPGGAITIQLLGSQDDMVSPDDNIDLVSGGDFLYLDVPYSGHANVIKMADPTYGQKRAEVFKVALCDSPETIREHAIIPYDERAPLQDKAVKRMVFVIHGIRDHGYWTHKIARRIKQRAETETDKWATETSSYGYFPMLPFMFPWYRRKKVEWLMDQYAEALSRYPNATFSYVGHSNGTYLLAKALELYPCCSFDHIVFAGSVVRSNYDWNRFLSVRPQRIKSVLNFVATSDWVVAFFPKFFEMLGIQDLGGAGHDGFSFKQHSANTYQITFIKGGHGAAIEEPAWDVITQFIVTGQLPDTSSLPLRNEQTSWITLMGKFPPFVYAIVALFLWGLWKGLEMLIGRMAWDSSTQGFVTGFSLAIYLLTLWLVVTRV